MSRATPCVVWADEDDLLENCDLTGIHPDTLTAAFSYASTVIYNLTRRRWPGLCTDTIDVLCGAFDWCDYGIELAASDVRAITSISIDGSVIAASDYELRDRRRVIAKRRADGSMRGWPYSSDLSSTAVGRFVIVYTHGGEPPTDGVRAAAILAFELALGWTPECAESCRLPQRITTVTRAGMTFAVVDPLTLFKEGLTGLPDVDMLVQTLNRGETTQRTTVMRPGEPSKASRIT